MMKRSLKPVVLMLCLLLLLSGCGSTGTASEPADGTELEVYCFSAGKADAFLLYTDVSAVLIDCGEKGFGKEILSFMAEAGIDRLDYLIITHFDQDHVGGAAKILNNFPVDVVLQSNSPKESEEYQKYLKALSNAGLEAVTVRETLRFALDGVSYTVDPPRKNDYSSNDSNNSSLIVSVTNGENRLLFTGDAQNERIAEFLAQNQTDYDFLKVPYHGHWQESLPELIASVRPEYAVITSSDEEPEDTEALSVLEGTGTEIYLTRSGPILLHCDGTEIQIEAVEDADAAA